MEDPTYSFNQDGLLEVRFKPPTKTILDEPLRNLGGFYIDRSENKITPSYCATCPVEFTDRLEILADVPPPGQLVVDRTYSFTDDLRPGYAYHYRILAHDKSGDHAPGRFASLVVFFDSPSRPPEGLEALPDDRMVQLRWPVPGRLVDGRPAVDISGYDVYRRGENGPWVRLNPEGQPVNRTFYRDDRVVNGRKYYYQVRAVRNYRGSTVAGPPSVEVSVVPTDLTPPPPPVKVYAAPAEDGISLAWEEADAAEAAGYRLYRRLGDETEFKRIGPELLRENRFVDRSVRRGVTYEYRVTTVDGSPQANESEPAPSVRIKYE